MVTTTDVMVTPVGTVGDIPTTHELVVATVTEAAWSVDGPVPAPNNEEGDDPDKWMTEEILSGAWDVSDAEGAMIKEYMKKFNLKP